MPSMLIRHHAMYYQDIGSGFPILLGHSYLWDRKMWQPQIDFLSEHFRCIVPDLWSHGYSEEIPQRPYSLDQLSEDHFYLMKSLNINEFGIVGLSVGGMWGTLMALNHPQAVKAMVLMDTFVGEESAESKQTYFELLSDIEQAQKFTDDIVNRITPYFFSPKTLAEKSALVLNFQSKLKQTPHERLAGLIEMGYTIFSRHSIIHKLNQLNIPVQIICGEQDLPRPVSESNQMAQAIPNASFLTIPDAGHMANLEQPEKTNTYLSAFLMRHLLQLETLA